MISGTRIDLKARARALKLKIAGLSDSHARTSTRRAEVEDEIGQLTRRLAALDENLSHLERSRQEAEDELEAITALLPDDDRVPDPRPARKPQPATSNTKLREAILTLHTFTDAELAGVLGVTVKQVEPLIEQEAEKGIIRATGEKFSRRPVFEYTPPTEAGAAFENQQAHRAEQEPVEMMIYADPVAGVSEGLLSMLAKDVRKVVRGALRDGWTLSETGGGHVQLSYPGEEPLTFSKTPANPSQDAKMLRARLNRRSARRVVRGAPVDGTGKLKGRTGNASRGRGVRR